MFYFFFLVYFFWFCQTRATLKYDFIENLYIIAHFFLKNTKMSQFQENSLQ